MSWWEQAPVVETTIEEHEEELRTAFVIESLEPRLVSLASTALAVLLERTAQLERPASGSPESLRLHALMTIAVRTFRAARAGVAVLAAGYEGEARVHLRTLVELHSHQAAIDADPTGEEARAWLDRKRVRNVSRRVRDSMPEGAEGLYSLLSEDAHGDPAGVYRTLMLVDGDDRAVNWGPHRGPRARFVLHQIALYCALAAQALGNVANVAVPRRDELYRELHASTARLKDLSDTSAAS